MLVRKTVQSGKVVFIVDHFGLSIFVCCELNEILGLLLPEFYARGLQQSLHFFDFDVALSLGIQQSKGGQNSLWIIRLELLFF